MFRKNFDTIFIAAIFVVLAKLLEKFHFWKAIGLSEPHYLIFSGMMFLFLVVLFEHTIFAPFSAIATERYDLTTEKRKRAEDQKNQAENILKSYEKSILDARMNALKQRERIALEGEQEEKKILDSAKLKSQQSLDLAIKEISGKIVEARGELDKSKGSLVSKLVEEILSSQIMKIQNSTTTKSVESRV